MATFVHDYSIPVLLAVLLHVFAAASAYVFDSQISSSKNPVFEPNYVSAALLVLERDTARSTAPPDPQSVPPMDLNSLPSENNEDRDELGEADQSDEEREALRQLRLEELRNSIFADDLLRESRELQDVTIDQESTSYINAIYSAIVVKWSRPPSATRDMETVLRVELFPTGELDTVEILESSGNESFDHSTISAVKAVEKFAVPKNSQLFERRFRTFNLRFRGEDLLR